MAAAAPPGAVSPNFTDGGGFHTTSNPAAILSSNADLGSHVSAASNVVQEQVVQATPAVGTIRNILGYLHKWFNPFRLLILIRLEQRCLRKAQRMSRLGYQKKNVAASAKETAATAVSGKEKAKATVQEKDGQAEKVRAHGPEEKNLATEMKEEKETRLNCRNKMHLNAMLQANKR
ncbi:hypothetical protein POM88_042972 [Heracleum sosnowskyi]|uniref:Uncharacterized protein n=1 Tax=Heracleum sosnowskyi TaxID=360622 RepID=A0AAD8MB46_9APIA|nr:hypothetical protein POM88_042972 [Heracleum sosnowskyi]